MTRLTIIIAVCGLIWTSGCQKAYYGTMETFGYHKRDILVNRVEQSRDAQEQAKEQFKTALEKFTEVVNFDGGDLQKQYDRLKSELDKSHSRADQVTSRIKQVEEVSEALFDEWQKELEQYTSDKLKRSSADKLAKTRYSYNQMIQAMKRAEAKMEPVLSAFKDQVLFLKHNLNARAVASLHDELTNIEADIALLIKDMEASIAQADAFISDMSG